MNPEGLLARLGDELGFSPELLGGRATVLDQIRRFLGSLPAGADPAADPALWSRLISAVTIPETSFFRYPESFAALLAWAAGQPRGPLELLCLPCSTGEEAWSIAMTLREADIADFRLTACDASPASVARAAMGRYSPRSLQGVSDGRRERWFVDETVRDDLRRGVRFETANIFTREIAPQSLDVVFCRNLLIYFDAPNQRRAFERLSAWLKPTGVLFLGPGEATVAAAHGWKSTGHSMSFSFVRGAASSPPRAASRRPPRAGILPDPAPAPGPASEPTAPPPPALPHAQRLADAGRLEEAEDVLAKFHRAHDPTASSLLLRGLLEEARGDRAAAEASYRRALYLEPGQLESLLHLTRLLEAEGRVQAAAPLRRRLQRLAAAS